MMSVEGSRILEQIEKAKEASFKNERLHFVGGVQNATC